MIPTIDVPDRASGEEEELVCASCGSRDDVRPHPRMESVLFCAECLEVALGPMDRVRFGIGTQVD